MTPEEQEQMVYQAISRVTQAKGLELIEVKISQHQKDVFIEVLADELEAKINVIEQKLGKSTQKKTKPKPALNKHEVDEIKQLITTGYYGEEPK